MNIQQIERAYDAGYKVHYGSRNYEVQRHYGQLEIVCLDNGFMVGIANGKPELFYVGEKDND